MDRSDSNTAANLESAFAGESMANRKYLFFAEVVSKLDLPKVFDDLRSRLGRSRFWHRTRYALRGNSR
jgi:rubrerythrin